MITLVQGLFLYFAAMIVACALVAITRHSAVNAVLAVLLMFFHVAGLYVLLNAEFLAAIQIIVYAGAILVFYLFVVMLLNIRTEELGRRAHPYWPALVLVVAGLAAVFVLLLSRSLFQGTPDQYSIALVQEAGNAQLVSQVLYRDYYLPFEVASVILLVAMIGAVLLARRRWAEE